MASGIAHVDVGVQLTRSEWNAAATHAITYILIPDGVGHYLQLPKLTTAQRNALTAVNGMIIYNSTTTQVESYENDAWVATATILHKDSHDPEDGSDALDCAAPSTNITPEQTNAEGSAHTFARSDHMHYLPSGAPSTVAAANSEGTAAAFARQDHIHEREHAKYTDAEAQAAAVSDTAYGVGWNGVTDVAPSKNAVYDKIEAIGGVVFTDYRYYTDLAAAATYTPPAQSMATVTSEGDFGSDEINLEYYDDAAWLLTISTGQWLVILQDANQNNRFKNDNVAARKIHLTGVTWA